MSEAKHVRWSQWDANGRAGAGHLPVQRVQETLQNFEVKARNLLAKTGADHVVYGVKYYDKDGELEEVRFYLQPMDDERFDRDIANMKSVTVYAVHKMGNGESDMAKRTKSTIGYEKARNLMRQLDWRMRVSILGDSVEKIVLFHPKRPTEYTVRMDSGRKLMRECVLQERLDSQTAVLCYNRVEAEIEAPEWFAVTRWAPEDAIAAAKEQGVALTMEQAAAWWKRNESRFQNLIVEAGNNILADMNFEEED